MIVATSGCDILLTQANPTRHQLVEIVPMLDEKRAVDRLLDVAVACLRAALDINGDCRARLAMAALQGDRSERRRIADALADALIRH